MARTTARLTDLEYFARRCIPGGRLVTALGIIVLLAGGVANDARAQNAGGVDGIDDSALSCKVSSAGVHLTWNIQFFAPIGGFLVHRDGEPLARLPASATDFLDSGVGPGEHEYELFAISLEVDQLDAADRNVVVADPVDPANLAPLGRCAVVVPDRGLRCRVDENKVHLEWGPILIRIAFERFRIERNGVTIATVPKDQLSYTDEVFSIGSHQYAVFIVVDNSTAQDISVGRCEVEVECFGVRVEVDGLDVHLDWSHQALPEIASRIFTINRDGEIVGKTQDTRFVDTAPAPGSYIYQIVMDFGTDVRAPSRIIAACRVEVPQSPPPAPEDLTCVVAIPIDGEIPDPNDPAAVDLDQDGIIDVLPGPAVVLRWVNPVAYDRIVITRDNQTLARIEGDRTRFVDHPAPGGEHVYGVYGVVADSRSRSAECRVEVPPTTLPPPRDLACRVALPFDPAVDLAPRDVEDGVLDEVGDILPGLPAVILRWVNPIDYDRIVVTRDGTVLMTIAGDRTSFIDHPLAGGTHAYGVYGIVGNRRSEAARCEVTVPPVGVPSPRDLTCAVAIPTPDPIPVGPGEVLDPNDPAAVDVDQDGEVDSILPRPSVILTWVNPVRYDRIVVTRNKAIVATLEGDTTRFVDRPGVGGKILYGVYGVREDRRSEPATCEVEVPPVIVPPPRDFTCELVRLQLDPNDPDNVLDPATPGDPINHPVTAVLLKWWNPARYARLVILRDGEEIATLPGTSTAYRDIRPPEGKHVYGIFGIAEDGRHSATVECEIDVGPEPVPPVRDLVCELSRSETDSTNVSVILTWELGGRYDAILIYRNDELIQELDGDARETTDPAVEPGAYAYCVVAVREEQRSSAVCCRVLIEGPTLRNLLYFDTSLATGGTNSGGGVEVPIDVGRQRTTCLADNEEDVQGWSFGVASDPKFIVPESVDLDDTVTQAFNDGSGADFLAIELLEDGGGVTMAAVISEEPPFEVLPAGEKHALLNIDYEGGPSGLPGVAYPVRYTSTLGTPPVAVLYVVDGFEVSPSTVPGFVVLRGPRYRRGDASGDGLVDPTDAIVILLYLFVGGEEPSCLEAANVNGSRQVNIADSIFLLTWQFFGTVEIPPPFPDCDFSPAPLGCRNPVGCE